MAKVNVFFHKETSSWWTDSELDGIKLVNYIANNPIGLGVIETLTNEKPIGDDIHEIHSMFIPDYIKQFNRISNDIEVNGLQNAQSVSKRQLKKMLK